MSDTQWRGESAERGPAVRAGAEPVSELAETLRAAVQALHRRRRELLTVFLVVFFAVQVIAFLWPGTYVARAAILIQKNRFGGSFSGDAERAPTIVSAGTSEEEVNSEIAVLTSREVLTKTMADTGLDQASPRLFSRLLFGPVWLYEDLYAWAHGVPGPTQADRTLRGIESSISVDRLKDSNVLVVSFEAGHPAFAQAVLERILANYEAHHVEVHRRSDAARFFDQQASELQQELEAHEDALQKLKHEANVADFDAERRAEETIDTGLRAQLVEAKRTLAEMDQRILTYETMLQQEPATVRTGTTAGRSDFVLQSLVQEKLSLELERARLLERYTPGSPLLVENERKLAAATSAIEAESRGGTAQTQTAPSPARLASSRDLARTRAERAGVAEGIAQLESQIAASAARMRDLDTRALEGRRVERLIAASETKYLQYLRRGAEARIDTALDAGRFTNATVVQEPAAEAKPIRPRKLRALLFGLAGGLLAAVGYAVVEELRVGGLEPLLGSLAPRPTER